MLINKQIKNTLYTLKRQSIGYMPNMLYSPHGSFFDAALQELPNTAPAILTLSDKPFIDSSYYNCLWLNDLIDFSQKIPYYANFHTNLIIAIHDIPAAFFKKEDLSILQNNVSKYNFISFTDKYEKWSLPNVKYVPYGVVAPNNKVFEKTKDILIINTRGQKQINILHQYINSEFPQSDILHQIPRSIHDIQNIISQYKICIDFDYYYNLILANACGTYGITSIQSSDDNIYTADNSAQIITLIKMLLNNKTNYEQIKENITKKYNWDIFVDNICSYIGNAYYEEFII